MPRHRNFSRGRGRGAGPPYLLPGQRPHQVSLFQISNRPHPGGLRPQQPHPGRHGHAGRGFSGQSELSDPGPGYGPQWFGPDGGHRALRLENRPRPAATAPGKFLRFWRLQLCYAPGGIPGRAGHGAGIVARRSFPGCGLRPAAGEPRRRILRPDRGGRTGLSTGSGRRFRAGGQEPD